MIKLVMFDLDGTLVDAYRAVCQSVNYTLKSMGEKARSHEEIKHAVGMGDTHLLAHFVGEERGEAAARIYRTHHARALLTKGGVRYLPGAKRLLSDLRHQGHVLAIVTNRPARFTAIVLKHLDMKKYFHFVLCADKTGMPKPDPGMVFLALKRTKMAKKNALFVGDMGIDVRTAKAAGVRVAAVTTGSSALKELKSLHPDQIISKIAEIKNIIKELENE